MIQRSMKERKSILNQSIAHYKNTIFNDINLSVRIIEKEKPDYITRLIQWDDHQITFFAPISKGDFILYSIGETLEIHFLTNSGIYHTHIKILSKDRSDGNLYYVGEICTPIIRKQQREYFRLSTLLNLKFSLLLPDTPATTIHTLLKIDAISTNISAGGMCILSETKLNINDKIYIYLDFLSTPIEVIGQILTVDEKNEYGKYTYRIRFEDPSTQTRDLIMKLIFEKQRLERSSNRNAQKKMN